MMLVAKPKWEATRKQTLQGRTLWEGLDCYGWPRYLVTPNAPDGQPVPPPRSALGFRAQGVALTEGNGGDWKPDYSQG